MSDSIKHWPAPDAEETEDELATREEQAEAELGHRLAAHYDWPVEVLEAIEVTGMGCSD
ncbi:hypothetical protein [Streptomyces sp. NPDC047014]|uniref:hypothetical protein n=1 Tax=Streptomyces sp. NPDC047014 TaxID=3155736 RepID=UPI0033D8292F